MISVDVSTFADWRVKARQLINQNIAPSLILWSNTNSSQSTLFQEECLPNVFAPAQQFFIPKPFLPLAQEVAYHRNEAKWDKLYALLWRLTHGEKHLLSISSDELMHELLMMQKSISRDAHKMKAFVRFCKFHTEDDEEHYLAWYKPDHLIVRKVAPFFQRRFEVMKWTIVTPDETVHWNGDALTFSAGKNMPHNPIDELEYLWQTYYKAIFNPARVKIKAMKSEMPVKYWHNLPETRIIPELLKEAPQRVAEMLRHQDGFNSSASDYLPTVIDSLNDLKVKAIQCKGCPLSHNATQTVFGQGNKNAKLILVGEQPGEQEDKQGIPFVGPAGQLLRTVLAELSINPEDIYLTNAVKHFKFKLQEGRKIHLSPSIKELIACKPWLLAEINFIKPAVVLCLGLTAAKSLINPAFRIHHERGQFQEKEHYTIAASFHPSAILRATGDKQKIMLANLKNDIIKAYILSNKTEC